MSEARKVVVDLGDRLLEDIDGIVTTRNTTHSEFLKEAAQFYLREIKRREFREMMRRGYQEMAEMNLSLAREAFWLENEVDSIITSSYGVRRE